MSPIRVVIADDHPFFRDGLRVLLESTPDTELTGEATTGEQAVALATELGADVILMDLRMPGTGGVEATRRIVAANPDAAVLVVSMVEDDDSILAAIRAGARGYLLKGADKAETLAAIRAVAHGEAVFGPGIAQRLQRFVGHAAPRSPAARAVAARVGANVPAAVQAGWLHNISAIVPVRERVMFAQALLPEELAVPMIVHQKLSVVLAEHVFGITDGQVLAAIGCHTTLKANATQFDKVVFVAGKIAWDQVGTPPYLPALMDALERSLDAAALVYLTYLWEQRARLPVIHPWFRAAYVELAGSAGPAGR